MKRKHPAYLLFPVAFVLSIACHQEKSGQDNPENTTDALSFVTLNTFSELPEEIDGCSCLFSENTEEFAKGNLLYADNLQDIAYISIENQMIRLDITGEDQLNSDEEIRIKCRADEYEVLLDARKSGQLDYTRSYSGTLQLKLKNGTITRTEITGECGC